MSLRYKLLVLSILLAILPLFIAGQNLIQISRNELKSSANSELLAAATDLARQVDEHYVYTWVAPIRLIQSGVENPGLGVAEKLALLKEGMRIIDDLVALQISVEGIAQPLLVVRDEFADRLQTTGADPREMLLFQPSEEAFLLEPSSTKLGSLDYEPKTGSWILTILFPMNSTTFGRPAILSAKVTLAHLQDYLSGLPLNQTGFVALVDKEGRRIFDPQRTNLADRRIVKAALELLVSDNRSVSVEPYALPGGDRVLGGYAFPANVDWAVVVEQREAVAYAAVFKMERSLNIWILIGLAVAVVGGIALAISLTQPLERLTAAAIRLAKGDLATQVERANRRDEIGTLATTFNKMVTDLNHYIVELTETTAAKERAESELKLAWNIQKSFLPSSFPRLERYDLFGACEPAREVGGDYFDVVQIDENRYGLVIGDVSGKGVPAALFMSGCRTLFRILSADGAPPDQVLRQFNERLVDFDQSASMFITIFYGILHLDSGKFVYASAGHNMPYIRRSMAGKTTVEPLPPMRSLVAGIMEGIEYAPAEVTLGDGDLIALYTDGLIESINLLEEEFGEERLAGLIDSLADDLSSGIVARTLERLRLFQEGKPQFDDMTMLVVKRS